MTKQMKVKQNFMEGERRITGGHPPLPGDLSLREIFEALFLLSLSSKSPPFLLLNSSNFPHKKPI